MCPLNPGLEQELRSTHDRLTDQGKLLSEERRSSGFRAFRTKFGPSVLQGLDGPELLHVMHAHGNRESLVYWLEYKNDEEFAGTSFGGIGGGGSHMYNLFRREGQWITGPPRKERRITEAEAIVIARRHRDQLLKGAELLERLPSKGTDADYLALQGQMNELVPDLCSRGWAHKYFFLNFPDKLDDFHNEAYQRRANA